MLLLPPTCGGCDAPGWAVCPACAAVLRTAPPLPAIAGVDHAGALLAYEGPARRLVAGLKYRNNRAALRWLGGGLAALVGQPPDVVTWVPTDARRRRRRGFDQAELLARAVARRLARPARPLLVRPRQAAAAAQTGRSRADRLAEPPRLVARGAVPAVVLLVDDVVTTGSTLAAGASALRRAGARVVLAAAAAHPRSG